MKVDLDVDAAAAAAMLGGIAERGVNMGPPFGVISKLLEHGRAATFDSAGSYVGEPWPPLRQSTAERKSRQHLPSETMVETGELKSALEGGEGAVTRITPTTIAVGVTGSLYRARFQMAQGRQLMRVRPEDEVASVELILQWIEGKGH